MKNLIALLLLLTITTAYGQNNPISLIPQPAEIQQSAGVFCLAGHDA